MRNAPREIAPSIALVVDYDPDMRNLLRDVLERQGHRVLEEADGEKVLPLLESGRVGVVVLDKEMPGVNGMDLLRSIRRRWPTIPVILITAFGGPRVKEEALRLGAARYLEKPFRVTELLEAVGVLAKSAAYPFFSAESR